MKRYRKVLRQIDESVMSPLPKTRSWHGDSKRAEQMYENLWAQFGLTKDVREKWKARVKKQHPDLNEHELKQYLPCVNEWAWTKESRDAFYSHPYHKRFVAKVKKMRGMTWGLWVLDSEPADYRTPEQRRKDASETLQRP